MQGVFYICSRKRTTVPIPFTLCVDTRSNFNSFVEMTEISIKQDTTGFGNLVVPLKFGVNLESDFNNFSVYNGLPFSHIKNMEG